MWLQWFNQKTWLYSTVLNMSHMVWNKTKDAEGETVCSQKIKWLPYTKEDPKGGKQEYRDYHGMEPKKLYRCPPGIIVVKKEDLLILCTNGSIPQSYVDFCRPLQFRAGYYLIFKSIWNIIYDTDCLCYVVMSSIFTNLFHMLSSWVYMYFQLVIWHSIN